MENIQIIKSPLISENKKTHNNRVIEENQVIIENTQVVAKRKRVYIKCEHDKRVSRCTLCGGTELCNHKRYKNQCKDCKGGSICEHNRVRSSCTKCKGGHICDHNKVRARCGECNGSQICEHNKYKLSCITCKGSQICEHNKRRNVCVECGGNCICEHNKIKYYCIDCDGTQICEHKKHKSQCLECDGSQICIHKKYKSDCKVCGGSDRLCKSEHCETRGMSKYNGYCMPCCIQMCPDIEVYRNYKTKENDVVGRVKLRFPNFDWVADKRVQDGCSRRRPDLLLDMGSHIIIIEVDENKHTDYDCSCEHKRLMELSQDLQHRPIVFIRFNPDDYENEKGTVVKSCWKLNKLGVMQIIKTKEKEWEKRVESLLDQIQYWSENSTEKTIEIIELFY